MPSRGDLLTGLRQAAPAGLLIVLLGVAWLIPSGGFGLALQLASPDRSHVDRFRLAIADLP